MVVITHEMSKHLPHALGEAVVRIWGHLPQDVQCHLFENVIAHQGERMRLHLAVLLHEKHPRTYASTGTSAVLEPDSLGG